ncbi:hypothetical protein LA664_04420 [Lactobacillus amylolyticus]|uniref:Bacterial group 3 Ig-like protein n=1 Tax=Lactobacillus amylolyticus DSM 11664 TaxID=585524 RepID=D4YU31_9LACO|nr:hypothetical protein [Lactobacillus amylolyticus]EFG55351.1 hypothetical protein HMPREF0493_1042 [Lactobacillus amylolyticus DSM 11664]KRL18206.1 hypothetical protein FD39_GL000508 [Lactobacillus amylolyticus DSM 11664]QFY04517.1 hypothetical protein LA664_04420 [Lactobacillus amylolyticus]TDG64057.1 hypothetical protein C5L18_000911 [Lactobacillus amylolyticus]
MKSKWKFAAIAAGILLTSSVGIASNETVSAKSYSKAVTKIAGTGNYTIYHRVTKNGPSGKFTSTKYFKNGQIQSKKYISTIDLVSGSSYSFPTRDAINYVTDSQGTAINPSKVNVSQSSVSSKSTTVKYSYGKAQASVQVNVHQNYPASPSASVKKGLTEVSPWKGSSKSSSRNWNSAHGYRSETTGNTFKSNGLTLKTRLFQPRFVSLGYNQAADTMGQVGVIPEGMTVNGGIFTTSTFTSSSSQYGHLVSYNLNALKSKTAAQNLTTMKWSTFKSYAKNIKVSPYIKLGHGQSLGSSSAYIYVMANDNNYRKGNRAEEILQIRNSDMKINKIWTFQIADNRYIHNATFSGDGTMYALFHNGGNSYYEYWKLTLSNDVWHATEDNFVKNGAPVQGFAYGNGHFYVGFNDNIFKVAENGTAEKHYRFNVRREIEGISASGSKLYVQFAQRAELTSGTANQFF